MGFKKGNKEGQGRPKGAENKLTKEARELFIETLEGQVPFIEEAFKEVKEKNPAKYLELFAKYAQYFVPRKTENETKLDIGSFNFDETIKKLRGDK